MGKFSYTFRVARSLEEKLWGDSRFKGFLSSGKAFFIVGKYHNTMLKVREGMRTLNQDTHMMENGQKVFHMEKVVRCTKMETYMKVISLMERNLDREFIVFQMAECIREVFI